MKLTSHYHEKPWGRTDLPAMFEPAGGRRIGEAWFMADRPLPLLAKYLFTGERLSIQVHPDDAQAKARSLPGGKTECWLILDAEEGATIALGLREPVDADTLREAAIDGSIERLVDWRPVRAGDTYLVPAGTIHAIGAGISLLEFQQNDGTTYRLYDYGRPRELHLDEAVAVADREPYAEGLAGRAPEHRPALLIDDPHFCLVQCIDGEAPDDRLNQRRRWVMPLDGTAESQGVRAGAGECLLVEAGAPLTLGQGKVLIGAEGPY